MQSGTGLNWPWQSFANASTVHGTVVLAQVPWLFRPKHQQHSAQYAYALHTYNKMAAATAGHQRRAASSGSSSNNNGKE